MTELISSSGVLLSNSEDVDLEAQDWLLSQLSMSLDEQEQESCEGLLTVKECREASNGMDTGKSPGVDGLTAEFYLAFWAVLGEDLVEVLNYDFQNGQHSVSQRRGLLSLIFKIGEKRIWRTGYQYLCSVWIIKLARKLLRPDCRKFCLLFCSRIKPVVFREGLLFRTWIWLETWLNTVMLRTCL